MKRVPTTKSKVYILTAVHNSLKNTKEFLKCIKKQTYKSLVAIIIDDGSTDKTPQLLSKAKPGTVVIRGNGKLWWTGSLYLGVEYILSVAGKYDYILTINNDCQFGIDYVSRLVQSSQKFNRSIIGSLVMDKSSSKIWDAGVYADWQKGSFVSLADDAVRNIKKHMKYGTSINVLPTKGTLFPIEIFRKIGNFDKKNFPHYLSDYEFTYRAFNRGFNLMVDYQAKIYNDTGNTGIGGEDDKKRYWGNIIPLLFSRRSRINIIDQFNIIRVSCPSKYKLKNYLLLVLKIIHNLLQIWPFTYFGKVVILLKRFLGIPKEKSLIRI
jgi:GT2 family glycosyltransferase